MAVPQDTRAAAAYGASQVTTAAALLIPSTSSFPYNSILVQNRGPNSIYLGWDANVTASNGIELVTGAYINFDIYGSDNGPRLYAICSVLQVSPADTRWMLIR